MKQALILAGGKGTRLSSRLKGLPKPLIDFGGNPLLWHQLKALEKYGFAEVIILVSFRSEKIFEYIEENNSWNLNIKIIKEEEPLGTAGAVFSIIDHLDENFLVVYGDTIFNIDFNKFLDFHIKKKEPTASIFVHPNDHPHDSDLIEIDEDLKVVRFHKYPHKEDIISRNLVNAALYIIDKECLKKFKQKKRKFDFAKDLFPDFINENIDMYAYISPEYIKDCGTPERLDSAFKDYLSGKIENSSLNNKQKVIFLDRDGTINKEVGHLKKPEEFNFIDGAIEAIKIINNSEFRCIVITNQPVVARGECTYEDLYKIHNFMEMKLGNEGAFIDRIYFCPHHPDSGFDNEVKELKIKCNCRKPAVGMLESAKIDFNIDLNSSWLIGDSTVDVKTADNFGIPSILLKTGLGGLDKNYDVSPDYICDDLINAVNLILSKTKE